MKTKLMFRLALVAVVSTGLILGSCKKKDEEENNNTAPHYQAATDNSIAEGVFNRAYNQISKASYKATGTKELNDSIMGNCPVLYISAWHSYPDTVILDYGTNCLSTEDYVVRSGKIITVITGPYIDSGTVVTSTFQNYHEIINGVDYQATGTQVIKNLGDNNAGHPVFSVDVTGASVISTHGTISYTSHRENEMIDGYDTWMNPFDDEYLVTGSASGNDINGEPFQITITQALDFNIFCTTGYWYTIKSGKFELSYPGSIYPTIYVDYGSGTCDYIIYVTINGTQYTVVYY